MGIQVKYATMIVNDMEESIRFYREVMGFDVDSQFTPAQNITITLMRAEGGAMLELIKNDIHDVGFYSIGMEVEDMDETMQALKSKGAKIIAEPVPIMVGSLAFAEDPNGVKLAIICHTPSGS